MSWLEVTLKALSPPAALAWNSRLVNRRPETLVMLMSVTTAGARPSWEVMVTACAN